VSPERDEFQEDDEQEEFASRSIFAAGWFRAVLILTVVAIVVVVSLPWLLNWFEPGTSRTRTAKQSEPTKPPAAQNAPAPAAPAPQPTAPGTLPAAPKAVGPPAASPQTPARTEAEKPAALPPARTQAVEKPPAERSAVEKASRPPSPTRIARAPEPASRPASAAKPAESARGGYWVQIGAFKDEKNAENLAAALRNEGYSVQIARIARGGGDLAGAPQRHELFVTDAGVEKVNAALKSRGSAQAAPGGVSVRPAFELQEAMSISKQLSDQGLKVIVRPANGAQGGTTLYAVRTGSYPDRPRALAARDELSAKGHGGGFLTPGEAR